MCASKDPLTSQTWRASKTCSNARGRDGSNASAAPYTPGERPKRVQNASKLLPKCVPPQHQQARSSTSMPSKCDAGERGPPQAKIKFFSPFKGAGSGPAAFLGPLSWIAISSMRVKNRSISLDLAQRHRSRRLRSFPFNRVQLSTSVPFIEWCLNGFEQACIFCTYTLLES